MLLAMVYVADMIINKPVEKKAPLLSDATIQALMAKYNKAATAPVAYSNILDYSLGHANGYVITPGIPPGSLSINDCNTMCNGTPGCKGFQYNEATKACELLSNVSNTYFINDAGWNIFVSGTPPSKALTSVGVGQGFSATPSQKTAPIVGATTELTCAPYCLSNASTCAGFSISPSGCVLYADVSTPLQDATATSFKLTDVVHGQGLPPSSSAS